MYVKKIKRLTVPQLIDKLPFKEDSASLFDTHIVYAHTHHDHKSTVGKASISLQYQWLSVLRLYCTMAADLLRVYFVCQGQEQPGQEPTALEISKQYGDIHK